MIPRPSLRLAAWALLASICSLCAQEDAAPQRPSFDADDLFVPLSANATGPAGTLWAGGANWKARFADRTFTFFPWLGDAAREHRPWSWTTAGILVDGAPLDRDPSSVLAQVGPRLATLDHGRIVERYEVGPDGVEQTFVVPAPLEVTTDLVVTGRIDTTLHATPRPASHAALAFHDDDGRAVLTYGAATVFDAVGRRLAIGTAFDGTTLSLHVPAAWLRTATYPVTIDPLTSAVLIYTWGSGDGVQGLSIGRNPEHDELMVGFTRRFAVGDHDLYVRVANDQFGNRQTIHTDLADSHDTRDVSLDYVLGAHRWVVAYDDDYANVSRLQLYFHDGGVGAAVPGVLHISSSPAGYERWAPSFGGSLDANPYGYVVYRRDPIAAGGNSSVSEVYGARVNAATRTMETAFRFRASTNHSPDSERPSVSRQSENADGWLVVWSEYDPANANEDWDVLAQRVDWSGARRGWFACGPANSADLHKMSPVVAGTTANFRVAFLLRNNVGDKPSGDWGARIVTQRLVWSRTSDQPSGYATTELVEGISTELQLHGDGSLAYDRDLDCHWGLIWRSGIDGLFVTNIGYDGRAVETAQLIPESVAAQYLRGAITFDDENLRFPLLSSSWGGVNPISGRHLRRPPAGRVAYGVSCAGALSTHNQGVTDQPYSGSQFFGIRLDGAQPNASTWFFAAAGLANLPLPAAGHGSCNLLLDTTGTLIAAASGQTDATGTLYKPFAIPSGLSANIYWQAVQITGGSAWSSQGLRTDIR